MQPATADGICRTPAAAHQASLSHSDNGRLSTPWREVIFLSTVIGSIFEPSSPALVYGPEVGVPLRARSSNMQIKETKERLDDSFAGAVESPRLEDVVV